MGRRELPLSDDAQDVLDRMRGRPTCPVCGQSLKKVCNLKLDFTIEPFEATGDIVLDDITITSSESEVDAELNRLFGLGYDDHSDLIIAAGAKPDRRAMLTASYQRIISEHTHDCRP